MNKEIYKRGKKEWNVVLYGDLEGLPNIPTYRNNRKIYKFSSFFCLEMTPSDLLGHWMIFSFGKCFLGGDNE